MGGLLSSVVLVLVFAWLARALVGAKELTWRRTILAALAGIAVGDSVAIFLVTRGMSEITTFVPGPEFYIVGMPFRLVATMGAIVVLEVLFSRPRRRDGFRLIGPVRAIRRFFSVMLRGWEVTRVTARHGLGPLLGLQWGSRSAMRAIDVAQRARLALEECGGMFIKLGQLLASRPDLLPSDVIDELGRLHASAAPLPRDQVQGLIEHQLDMDIDQVFSDFDWDPLGSASIAQAHSALLIDGTPVVVKVRRPGIVEQTERDLSIARWLARIAERRTEWGRSYGVVALTKEFGDALRSELDFRVEARNLAEMARAVANDQHITVPEVVDHLTFDGVMVMERLEGVPLSQRANLNGEQARTLADALCRSQVGAMLSGRRFHGDPHPGNLLLLHDGRLGLIDMGITGRLDRFEQAAVFQMLVALKLEQPTLLYESMVSIGAVDGGQDRDDVERALAQFMASYLGSHLPPPEALTDLLRLTTELGLRLPPSATTMFRALATLAGSLEQLSPNYPLIDVVADLGGDQLRSRFMPSSASEYVQQEWAHLGPLLARFPRHVDRIATLVEHGGLTTKVRLFDDREERRFLERLVNRIAFTLLSIGTGAVSVMLIGLEDDRIIGFVDIGLYEGLGWLGLFIAITLLLRVLLAVLRSEQAVPRA